MENRIVEQIVKNPIIAALRNEKDIEIAVDSTVTTIFLLHADIFNIKNLVETARNARKTVLIHVDFLEGIGKDQKALDYLSDEIRPDGIITTKSQHIRYAKKIGMFTVQRFFLFDSQSFDTAIKTAATTKPDMIEILPGIMPAVIKRFTSEVDLPVIAGGLIDSKEEIIELLNSGAIGASVGKKELWIL